MRKTIATATVLMILGAWTVTAQEKSKGGHEGMAKGGGSGDDGNDGKEPARDHENTPSSATEPRTLRLQLCAPARPVCRHTVPEPGLPFRLEKAINYFVYRSLTKTLTGQRRQIKLKIEVLPSLSAPTLPGRPRRLPRRASHRGPSAPP